jgi:integrase
MTSFDELLGATPGAGATGRDILRLATVAYLARYKGDSRMHTESDLRIYLTWCAERRLEPLTVRRAHVEMYVRWLQEVRRFRPSTMSRRLSVVAGFYRTCVLDGILEHSPADHVRRPNVPPESPTLGLSHLQFEALLSAARASVNPNDFALVTMLGLLGLRIFEATRADIDDLGEEHGHRVLRVVGKGTRIVYLFHRRSAERSSAPQVTGPAGRFCSTLAEPGWTGTPPPAACAGSRPNPSCVCRGCTRTCSGTPS